jgi:mRNA interferase HigB
MIVFSYKTIRDFIDLHYNARDSLNTWYIIITRGDFSNFNELRKMFNSVDAVGNDLYVFNIKGNHYRLVARIHFNVRTVYIKFVGTHSQYDKLNIHEL